MRTLGLICASIALLGILAYIFFRDITPSIVVPVIIASGVLSIILIFAAGILGSRTDETKMFQCTQCGLRISGKRLKESRNRCPMCGGTVFA